jgi:hypothetical protein
MQERGYLADLLQAVAARYRGALTSSWPVAIIFALGGVAVLAPHPPDGSATAASAVVAIDWRAVAGKAAGIGIVAWCAIAFPIAFVGAYKAKHAALATAIAELAAERDRGPKLAIVISEAHGRPEGEPNSWLTILEVRVINKGSEAVGLGVAKPG